MDFKGIQVTLAVMSRAIIGGRIDCKTAGRLVVHLQTMSKLLWTLHKSKTLSLINTDNTDLQGATKNNLAANEREKARIALIAPQFAEKAESARNVCVGISLEHRIHRDRNQTHGPPKLRAA